MRQQLQRLHEARRKASGFTLIELLIVIVILGVLAAVVVIAVGAFTDRGQKAACKADVKSVETAVEAYRAKNTEYPDPLSLLWTNPEENYLKEPVPMDPGGDYFLVYDPATGGVDGFVGGDGTGAGAQSCVDDAAYQVPTP